MPELPEVETIARDMDAALRGCRLRAAEVRHPVVVADPGTGAFCQRLAGQSGAAVRRRGKFIVVDLSGGDHLVIHLRMTGRLLLQKVGTPPEKHTHVILRLQGNNGATRELHFHDTRRFGRLWLVDDAGLEALLARLGPEPLADDFTSAQLAGLLANRSTRLKPLLMDQGSLAGLGNIYTDEALFQAGLHPEREAKSLSPAEVDRLYRAIRQVLTQAVSHRGTSLSDAEYRDTRGEKGQHQGHVAVFRQQGSPCPRCGATIQRTRLAGRSTHFCPQCQPPPTNVLSAQRCQNGGDQD